MISNIIEFTAQNPIKHNEPLVNGPCQISDVFSVWAEDYRVFSNAVDHWPLLSIDKDRHFIPLFSRPRNAAPVCSRRSRNVQRRTIKLADSVLALLLPLFVPPTTKQQQGYSN